MCAEDLADIAAVVHVLTRGADADDATGRTDVCSGCSAQSDVSAAPRVVKERRSAISRVKVACDIGNEGTYPDGRVASSSGVTQKGERSVGRVV